MFADLLSSFVQSQHGESAAALLQDRHGLSADQANEALGHAGEAAAAAMHEQTAGHADPAAGAFSLLGGHAGSSFLMGALSGLARGESIGESLKDGLVGVVTGRVAEALAAKMGLPEAQASQIAAVIAPMLMHHAHGKLAEHPTVVEQHGAAPDAGGLGSLIGSLFGR